MANPALPGRPPIHRSPVATGLAYAIIPSLGLWALIGAAIWIA